MTQGKDGASEKPEPNDTGETPFQRFLRVARRVVAAPKSELDKRGRRQKPQEQQD